MYQSKRLIGLSLMLFVTVLFGLSVSPAQATTAIWCHDELTYPETVFGDDTDEIIVGTSESQKICTLGGMDSVQAGGGNDFVAGGDGADTLEGEGGEDILHGQDGNDLLLGGTDGDFLYGGAGDDEMLGGSGNDEYLYGSGDGHELIEDCFGDDTLVFPLLFEDQVAAETVGNDRVLTFLNESEDGSITLVDYELGCSQVSIVYRSGDTNGDGTADGSDWMYWLYAYVNESARHGLADINLDGTLNSADASCLRAQRFDSGCEQLVAVDSTMTAISVTAPSVVIPANATTVTVPLSLTVPAQTMNGALFTLRYDSEELALDTQSRDSVIAWGVSAEAVTLTDLNSQTAEDALNFLMVAPAGTGFDTGEVATITFDVVAPTDQDRMVAVQVNSADFSVQKVPTSVTIATSPTSEQSSSLSLFLLSALLVTASWTAYYRKDGG